MSDKKTNIAQKMAKLDELLAWFDGEDFELEEAIKVFAEAKKLADEIEHDLDGVKNTITVIGEQFDRDSE